MILYHGSKSGIIGEISPFGGREACGQNHIKVISARPLSDREVKAAKAQELNRGMQTEGIVGQLKTKYRRAADVKYFDEILMEWERGS